MAVLLGLCWHSGNAGSGWHSFALCIACPLCWPLLCRLRCRRRCLLALFTRLARRWPGTPSRRCGVCGLGMLGLCLRSGRPCSGRWCFQLACALRWPCWLPCWLRCWQCCLLVLVVRLAGQRPGTSGCGCCVQGFLLLGRRWRRGHPCSSRRRFALCWRQQVVIPQLVQLLALVPSTWRCAICSM